MYYSTKKLYTHAGALYRKTIVCYDREFTDDMEFAGELHYSYNGRKSKLWLEEDKYYGSDFDCMLNILDQYVAHYRKHDMVWRKSFNPEDRTDMTDKELRMDDFLDDGEPWIEYPLYHPALQKHSCLLRHACFLFALRLLHPRSTASERFLGRDMYNLSTIRRPARSVRTCMMG